MLENTKLQAIKQRLAKRFDGIANRYDLLATFNPGYGKHLRWSAERMRLPTKARILDLCCGTGLSTEALSQVYPDSTIDALDISEAMLAQARQKFYQAHVTFMQGDAMSPTKADLQGPYDGILMAYGIRNVVDPDRCLHNLKGLLKPGGRLCLHEYSVRDSLRGRVVWNLVSAGIILPAGMLTSPGSDIYRYLWRSVVDFDGVRELEGRLRSAGYTEVHTEAMDGWQKDIVHSFLATVPEAVQ